MNKRIGFLLSLVISTLFLWIGTLVAENTQISPAIPSNCIHPIALGLQPRRELLQENISWAATNVLTGARVPYPSANRGILHPTTEIVSEDQPIPPILLKGIFWQESRWLQFVDNVLSPDNTNQLTTLIKGK